VSEIHFRHFVHGGLNPQAILLNAPFEQQIHNFSDIRYIFPESWWQVYTAPECCFHSADSLTEMAGVFSYGAVLYAVFVEKPEFCGARPRSLSA
jgi:hypothetical protein